MPTASTFTLRENNNPEFVRRSAHYSFWNNYRTATSTVANLGIA
jgi:hypothetical protein